MISEDQPQIVHVKPEVMNQLTLVNVLLVMLDVKPVALNTTIVKLVDLTELPLLNLFVHVHTHNGKMINSNVTHVHTGVPIVKILLVTV
jgi:hypothetical protein